MPSRSKARRQLKPINSFREVRSMIVISSHPTTSPRCKVGQDAYAVIRDTIAKMNMAAIGQVVIPARRPLDVSRLLRCFGSVSRGR